MSEKKGQKEKKGQTGKSGTSTIEWMAAGIGCVALLSVLAYLVVDGVSGRNGTPELLVKPLEVARTQGGYVVEFSAMNQAGKSVAAVEINGELRDGDTVIEESSATLDYLPKNSERRGALIFRSDPNAHTLHLFASGFTEP